MSSTEEYLDNLLKAAMESDEKNTTDSFATNMGESFTKKSGNVAKGMDDEEHEMTHEEFVAMLASIDDEDEIEDEMMDESELYAEAVSTGEEMSDAETYMDNASGTDMTNDGESIEVFDDSMSDTVMSGDGFSDVDMTNDSESEVEMFDDSVSDAVMSESAISDIDLASEGMSGEDILDTGFSEIDMLSDSELDVEMFGEDISDVDMSGELSTEKVNENIEQDEDVDMLLESMAMEDEELAEINDLLKKSDSDEFPEDDMLAMLEEASEKNNESQEISIMTDIENEELFDFFGDMDAEEPIDIDNQSNEESTKELSKEEQQETEIKKKEKRKKVKGEKKKFSLFKKKKEQIVTNDTNQLSGEDNLEQNGSENGFAGDEENDLLGQLDDGAMRDFTDLVDLDGQNADRESDLFFGEDAIFMQGDIPEVDVENTSNGKNKGFFARMFDLLTEEVEDEIEEKPKKEKNKKGKKDKNDKGEKKKSENDEIVDELNEEDSQEGKKGKKKKKKPKKEKKQPAPEPAFMDNKLPRKMVIRIFVLCFSVLALIILINGALSMITSLSEARKAYYNKNYELVYENMIGKELNESDTLILEKTTIILKLQRKYDSYINYSSMGKHDYALNALLSGYAMYNESYEKAVNHNITDDYDMIKKLIVDALQNTYGVSEERAQELNAIEDSGEYQSALMQELSKLND